MNKSRTMMSCLAAIWAVGGFAASVVTEGTVTTLDVPEGEIYVYAEALAAPTTQFVKTGAGKARFGTAAPEYTGEILIREGVVDFTVPKAYGKGPITVSDGAQLVVSHESEGQNATSVAGTVTVAGSGPDGSGAIRFTGSGMGDCLFAKLVLAGDATIGGNRHGYKTIDFQHHVFTWVGGNLMVNGHTWMNFEKLVHNGTADICFQGWHGIDQSAAGKPIVVVNDRAHISFWGSTERVSAFSVVDGYVCRPPCQVRPFARPGHRQLGPLGTNGPYTFCLHPDMYRIDSLRLKPNTLVCYNSHGELSYDWTE